GKVVMKSNCGGVMEEVVGLEEEREDREVLDEVREETEQEGSLWESCDFGREDEWEGERESDGMLGES
ncbi:hypothetical protein, partial [Paenibacillus xylanexedens]|uniref:hypothetical protein n=1 Tax=Paenibacillus xylanexedens TaxID=528191 RepID=UPI001C92FF57